MKAWMALVVSAVVGAITGAVPATVMHALRDDPAPAAIECPAAPACGPELKHSPSWQSVPPGPLYDVCVERTGLSCCMKAFDHGSMHGHCQKATE